MNPELERLIDLALADGKLNDKELEVLYRKAIELAVNMDEFEMVLEGKLHLAQKPTDTTTVSTTNGTATSKSQKEGDMRKCPLCGASVKSFAVTCSSCGHVFRNKHRRHLRLFIGVLAAVGALGVLMDNLWLAALFGAMCSSGIFVGVILLMKRFLRGSRYEYGRIGLQLIGAPIGIWLVLIYVSHLLSSNLQLRQFQSSCESPESYRDGYKWAYVGSMTQNTDCQAFVRGTIDHGGEMDFHVGDVDCFCSGWNDAFARRTSLFPDAGD